MLDFSIFKDIEVNKLYGTGNNEGNICGKQFKRFVNSQLRTIKLNTNNLKI